MTIKGLRKDEAKTYECSQSTDNDKGSLGAKFEICSVSVATKQIGTNENKKNIYTMFRSEESEAELKYDGDCSIRTSFVGSKLTTEVTCSKLVLTTLNDTPVFPYDSDRNVDVLGGTKFSCNLDI